VIYGEHVRLRAPERSDLQNFVSWLNDPEVRAGLSLNLPFSLVEEENWFENMLKRPPAEHPMVIEVHSDERWVMVGNVGLFDIDWRCRSGEVGIFIGDKSFWNRGIGSEVMRLILRHGFNTLNLNRIMLQVYETNPRAIRTYEKAGFVIEGRKRQAMYKEGKYMDILMMSVLRSEWQDNQ
jgi:RimJ/RimL family protein N-acetyltransferase